MFECDWVLELDAQHHIAACMNTDKETATAAHYKLDRNVIAGVCNGVSGCKHAATPVV